MMTTMKKRGTAGEKKGFFDISCVVCLSEDFPLFPVVSHFLERHPGRALWVLGSSSTGPHEGLLSSLFHSRDLTTVALDKAREHISATQLSEFSLVVAGLSAMKGLQKQIQDLFNTGKQCQNTKFLVLCNTGPESILENRDFLEKT